MTHDNAEQLPDEPNYPDMTVETCDECEGDSDPLDDCFYCSQCKGRGWIYAQMIESPYHDHFDIERWNREEEAKHGKR